MLILAPPQTFLCEEETSGMSATRGVGTELCRGEDKL